MKETGLDRFNRQNHFYIDWVSYENIHGSIIISGAAGIKRYIGYSWRAAVCRYNAMARENGAYKHCY